jgi:uridine phosphorylase
MLRVGTGSGFSVEIDAGDRVLEQEAADSFGGATTIDGAEKAFRAWAAGKGVKVERFPNGDVDGQPLIRFRLT